jgi:nucleolar protein 58
VSARSSAGIVDGVGKKKRKSEGGSAVKEIVKEAIVIKEEEVIREIKEEEVEMKSPKKHKKDKKEKKEHRESRGEGHEKEKKEKKHKKDKQ